MHRVSQSRVVENGAAAAAETNGGTEHSAQAIVYVNGESDEEPSRKVPSNVVHLDATGRDVNAGDVRLLLLGGRERKPLEGMALSVLPSGGNEALAVTTDADGTASLWLLWGDYWAETQSPTERQPAVAVSERPPPREGIEATS